MAQESSRKHKVAAEIQRLVNELLVSEIKDPRLAGARTSASAIMHGAWVLVFALPFAGLIEQIPTAALAVIEAAKFACATEACCGPENRALATGDSTGRARRAE